MALMPRRARARLIDRVQRAKIFDRLRDAEKLDELDAEYWIDRWEREAERAGVAWGGHAFWDAGWHWIEQERQRPKADMSAEGDDRQVSGG